MLHGLLYVEDLTAQRQDGLVLTVASLLGRTACRVTLDEEELGECRVLGRAVGELAGEATA